MFYYNIDCFLHVCIKPCCWTLECAHIYYIYCIHTVPVHGEVRITVLKKNGWSVSMGSLLEYPQRTALWFENLDTRVK